MLKWLLIVSFLANNPDLHDREKLLCAPIIIKNNAWLEAGITVLAEVTIGDNGVGAVITKDVAPNTVVAGIPAKVITKIPHPEKINQGNFKVQLIQAISAFVDTSNPHSKLSCP